jgi:hypothetical protein
MVRNARRLKKFEDDLIKNGRRLSFPQTLKIFQGMWKEAKMLGAFRSKNLLEGIDKDIEMAKILNSCSKKS